MGADLAAATVRLTERLLTAEEVRQRWFLDAAGRPTVSAAWIRAHLPRVQLSRKVVRYRADDVELFLAARARAA